MRKSTRGFTLVELLVVIGVIAVLLAMLMPALQKVQAAAAKTHCAANLRQLGQAFHLYADENKGILPIYASANTGNIDGYFPAKPLNSTSPGWVSSLERLLSRHDNLLAWRVAQCPVRGRDYFATDWLSNLPAARSQGVTTYVVNNQVVGHQSTFWPIPHCRTPVQLTGSHKYMMTYWGSQSWCTEDYSKMLLEDNSYLLVSYVAPHSKTSNRLYNDGHVGDRP
ncbi:MAG TPA: type II secretion system protein [Roseimicrobium sp.]|nr:type II secretion system protein [Roseimicrobium sp.]